LDFVDKWFIFPRSLLYLKKKGLVCAMSIVLSSQNEEHKGSAARKVIDKFPDSAFYMGVYPLLAHAPDDYPLPWIERLDKYEPTSKVEQARDRLLEQTLERAGYHKDFSAQKRREAAAQVVDHIQRVFPVVFGTKQALHPGFQLGTLTVTQRDDPDIIHVQMGFTAHDVDLQKSYDTDGSHMYALIAHVPDTDRIAVSSTDTVKENNGMFTIANIQINLAKKIVAFTTNITDPIQLMKNFSEDTPFERVISYFVFGPT
jgi:hypothetical protein